MQTTIYEMRIHLAAVDSQLKRLTGVQNSERARELSDSQMFFILCKVGYIFNFNPFLTWLFW
jgi:hypothetical protein